MPADPELESRHIAVMSLTTTRSTPYVPGYFYRIARWEDDLPEARKILVVLGLHAVLGLAMHRLPPLATLHTISTALAVIALSLSTRSPAVILMCAAYVSGCEVLWRMSKAYTFHETAKYLVSLLCIVGMFRLRHVRLPGAAILYLALLLPSVVFTYYYLPLNQFRKTTMFNLSGPIATTLCILYCCNICLNIKDLWRVVTSYIAPVCGIATVTILSSYSDQIKFSTQSNFQTSGGFGPNQVSSSLSLGALMLTVTVLLARMPDKLRAALSILTVVLVIQSAMTFSRSGLLSYAAALACALPILLVQNRNRWQILVALAALCAVIMLLLSFADAYTGGKLFARFADKRMTGREQLAEIDWELFKQNPLFGVGVGISSYFHPRRIAAHTEFTRALGDHGILGLLAYSSLGWLVFRRVAGCLLDSSMQAAYGFPVALIVWALLYMSVNAMRTSSPALALGLSFLTVVPSIQERRNKALPL